MDQPIDQMYIDASRKNDQKLAEGGICLEYDITAVILYTLQTTLGYMENTYEERDEEGSKQEEEKKETEMNK